MNFKLERKYQWLLAFIFMVYATAFVMEFGRFNWFGMATVMLMAGGTFCVLFRTIDEWTKSRHK